MKDLEKSNNMPQPEKISDADLNQATGGVNGTTTKVYNPWGSNDIAYTCPNCNFKVEINSGQKWNEGTYKNSWNCPQCKSKNLTIFNYEKNSVFSNSVSGTTYKESDIKNLDL